MNGCVHRTQFNYCEYYSREGVKSWCDIENCTEVKPSNGDKIRAMSDEELSIWLDDITGETGDVPWCVLPCVQADNPRGVRYCEKCAENWLKQEAKHD